jgi:hypothetical protein
VLSQQRDEVEGSLTWGTPGRVGSSPDNAGTVWHCQTGRVRQTRSEGGTEVNQWLKLRKKSAGSNLVDMGRGAVRDLRVVDRGSTLKPSEAVGDEATLKACGVGVAMLSG